MLLLEKILLEKKYKSSDLGDSLKEKGLIKNKYYLRNIITKQNVPGVYLANAITVEVNKIFNTNYISEQLFNDVDEIDLKENETK